MYYKYYTTQCRLTNEVLIVCVWIQLSGGGALSLSTSWKTSHARWRLFFMKSSKCLNVLISLWSFKTNSLQLLHTPITAKLKINRKCYCSADESLFNHESMWELEIKQAKGKVNFCEGKKHKYLVDSSRASNHSCSNTGSRLVRAK